MKDKICLITGANAGLGLEAACQLAEQGATLILICRNLEKATIAKNEILNRKPDAVIHLFAADLSVHQEIKEVCGQIRAQFSKIDVLLNNAGAVFSTFTLSKDGIEMTMAVNHFAYYLLTYYLLDLVEASDYARIINVASESHASGKIEIASFTQKHNYFIFKAYAQSKLANLLFTLELNRKLRKKGSHVTVNALNPGRVKTEIGIKNQHWFFAGVWRLLTNLTAITILQGVKVYIYLATSPEMAGKSGLYFDELTLTPPTKRAQDETLAQTLWQESEKLTGVSYRF